MITRTKKILQIAVVSSVILLFVVIAAYLILTSNVFIRSIVVPRVAERIGAPISVAEVSFSPFRKLVLRDLVVGDPARPLIRAKRVRLRHSAFAIAKGTYRFHHVQIADADIYLAKDQDGKLNIPEMLFNGDGAVPAVPESAGRSATIRIGEIEITNVSVTYEWMSAPDSQPEYVTVRGLNATGGKIEPDSQFELSIEGAMSYDNNGGDTVVMSDGDFTLNGFLGAEMLPELLLIKGQFANVETTMSGRILADRVVSLDGKLKKDKGKYVIDKCNVSESFRNYKEWGVDVSGIVDPSSLDASIRLTASIRHSEPLNYLGAGIGDIDFGDTNLDYTGKIEISERGQSVAVDGTLGLKAFSLVSDQLPASQLKPVDLTFSHHIKSTNGGEDVTVSGLSLAIRKDDTDMLDIFLSKSVTFAFGENGAATTDEPAVLKIASYGLQLDMISGLVPPDLGIDIRKGKLLADIDMKIHGNGAKIEATGLYDLDNIQVRMLESDTYRPAKLKQEFQLTCESLNHLQLSGKTTLWAANKGVAMTADMSGTFDFDDKKGKLLLRDLELQPSIATLLPDRLVELVKLGNINGTGEFACVVDDPETARFQGELALANLELTADGFPDLPSVSPVISFDVRTDAADTITLDTFSATVTSKGKNLIDITVNGPLRVDPIDANLNLEVRAYPMLSRFLPDEIVKQAQFRNLNFRTRFNSRIHDPDSIHLQGRIEATDVALTVAGYDELPPLSPVAEFDLRVDSNNTMAISHIDLTLSERDTSIAEIQMSGLLGTAARSGDLSLKIPLISGRMTDIANRFIADADISDADITYDGNISFDVEKAVYHVDGVLGLKDFSFHSDAWNVELTEAVDVRSTFDLRYDASQMLELQECDVSVRSGDEIAIALSLVGNLDTALSGRNSKLAALLKSPVDMERLPSLLRHFDGGEEAEIVTDPKLLHKRPEDAPKLVLELSVSAPAIFYDDFTIKEFNGQFDIALDQVSATSCSFFLNGGESLVSGVVGLTDDFSIGDYRVIAGVKGIGLGPMFRRISPLVDEMLTGKLMKMTAEFSGSGTEFSQIRDSLNGDLRLDLDNLKVNDVRNELVVLLSYLGVAPDDFTFEDGVVKVNVENGIIYVSDAILSNPELRLKARGQVEFGGKWNPNMDVVPGFAGKLAEKVEKKGGALTDSRDGYLEMAAVRLEGRTMEYLVGTFMPDLLFRAGVISSRDKAIANAVGRILGNDDNPESGGDDFKQAVLDAVDDYTRKSKNELKTKDARNVETGLKILKGLLDSDQTTEDTPNGTNNPDPSPESVPEDD